MGKAERRKGLNFQAEVADWLAERGWRVVNLPIGSRYQHVRDVFGCDLIAKHPERGVTLWIQATSDPKASWLRKAVPMQLVPWNWKADRVLIIKRRSRHDWVIRRLTPAGLVPFGIVVLGTLVQAKGVRFEF